jgi:hypothetical protein
MDGVAHGLQCLEGHHHFVVFAEIAAQHKDLAHLKVSV